jgi:hypothetical protein
MEIEEQEFYWKNEIRDELEYRMKQNKDDQWAIIENFGCKNIDE